MALMAKTARNARRVNAAILLAVAPLAFYGGFALHGWVSLAAYVLVLTVPGLIALWFFRWFRSGPEPFR